MRISQQPRLVAVVPLVVLALLLGMPAFAAAQFVQSDLGDTWHVRGFHTDNGSGSKPAQWISGTLTLSSTGIAQSGSVTLSDATVETITAGRLTLAANGLVSGTLTVGGVVRTVRATMTSDKGSVVGVADNAAHTIDTTFALSRLTTEPRTLSGGWVVFMLNSSEDLLPGTTARGFISAHGPESDLLLTSSQFGNELFLGAIAVNADGVVTGSFPHHQMDGVLNPARDMIVGVDTRENDPARPERSFFVALRQHAATLPDLVGVWRTYLHTVAAEIAGGGWLEGLITLRPNGEVAPGTLRNADGSALTITGGQLTTVANPSDPSEQISGTMLIRIPGVPAVFPVEIRGSASPTLDRVALTARLPVVNPNNPTDTVTIAGLAVMSRQPSTVQFSAATYTATEPGSSTARVTVTRAGAGTVTVDWATTPGGTTTAGSDYTGASGTLTFTGTETTKQFDVTILDDSLLEGQETIDLVLRNPTGGAMIGPRGTATILVKDDDQSVEFATPGITVSEEITRVTVTLKRNGPPITAFTVPVVYAEGGIADVDFSSGIIGSAVTASFAVGQVAKTVTVPLLDDTVIDGNKFVLFKLGTPSAANVRLGSQTDFTIRMTDNDTPGTVKFAVPASTVVEGALAKLTVLRSGAHLAGDIRVGYAVEAGSTATADVDYKLLGTGTLTFAVGQTSQTISVQTIDDTIAEPSETVIIRLIGLGPIGTVPSVPPITDIHTLTIKDNDVPGVLRFTVADLKVKEGDSGTTPVTLTVTRGAGTTLASGVTVDFAVGGLAENGSDYTLSNGTLSFGAGEASKTITIPIHGDLEGEGDETIEVRLSNPTGRATLGSPSMAKITIVDNDAAVYFPGEPVIRVSEATPSVTVTVARSGPATIPFTVPINVTVPIKVPVGSPRPAVPGVDYVDPPNSRIDVVFPVGVVTKTVSIKLLDDKVIDGPRQLALALGSPSDPRVATGTQSAKLIVITDNDTAGVIGFALPSTTLLEGEVKQVVVTRTGTNLAGGVTVTYAFVTNPAPDATPLADFRLPGSGVLTFNAGAATASTTIEVRALTDALREPVESFVLKLSAPSDGGTLAPGKDTHVVRIVDANQSGVIQWERAAVTTNEEAGSVELKIKRTGVNLAQDVAVSYAIDGVPGTATPGSDYTFTAGSVTFGAGETEKTVTVSLLNDVAVEPTETIRITLSAPTNGATLGAIKTVSVSIAEGAERFTGRWALSFSGVLDGIARTGTGELSIGEAIQVSRFCIASPCDGPTASRGGSVDFTGAGRFGVAPATFPAGCNFIGAFTGASTGAATARGTFECAPLGGGTWTATRTSTTPAALPSTR